MPEYGRRAGVLQRILDGAAASDRDQRCRHGIRRRCGPRRGARPAPLVGRTFGRGSRSRAATGRVRNALRRDRHRRWTGGASRGRHHRTGGVAGRPGPHLEGATARRRRHQDYDSDSSPVLRPHPRNRFSAAGIARRGKRARGRAERSGTKTLPSGWLVVPLDFAVSSRFSPRCSRCSSSGCPACAFAGATCGRAHSRLPILFNVGRLAIGLYLGQSATISAYAAAASLSVLLLWLYYSAQIFLFGAEFTWVHAQYRLNAQAKVEAN